MSIASDILAQTPLLYWKLDELVGPTIFDSSGNGFTTAPTGSYVRGVAGPEVGTYALQLTGGSVSRSTPLTGNVDQTMLLYASMAPAWNNAGRWFSNGDGAMTTRGIGLFSNSVSAGPRNQGASNNNLVATTIQIANQPVYFWHCFGLTYDHTAKTMACWTDGTGTSASSVWGTPVMANAGDLLQVTSPFGVVVAHLALFNRILTAGQMAGIGGHSSVWPYGLTIPYPSSNAPFATTTETTALGVTLAQILAAVQTTFPATHT